jgi:hypothetical protein
MKADRAAYAHVRIWPDCEVVTALTMFRLSEEQRLHLLDASISARDPERKLDRLAL